MDRGWTQNDNRRSPEYINGVVTFMNFSRKNMKPGMTQIWCPCCKCNNRDKKTPDEAEIHLYSYGIVKSYIKWVYHGENFQTKTNDECSSNEDSSSISGRASSPNIEMREIMHDINVGETGATDGSNLSRDKFARLMKDAEQELYPGCRKFSKLSFIVELLHVKTLNRWINKSFNMVLKLIKKALPDGEKLPGSYNETKRLIRDLGLDYEKIHACKNDCVLFWKEYKDEEQCPTCKAPRYKYQKDNGKKVPCKVLRYFPLKPRLKRLFVMKKNAVDMRWHKEKRVDEKNVLRHPADGAVWKDFDKQHESFASDPRNVRLGLATDGFNPFGTLSNSYSIWPVFLVPYNFPPWKCMKYTFTMMPLLIPGRRSPGFDIDVYLRPLIDELLELWEVGVETYDASTGKNFLMHAVVLWTVNDFPAYSNLSGWSTKGKLACPPCNADASHQYLSHGKKTCYMGHRRFFPYDRFLRTSLSFSKEPDFRSEPMRVTRYDVLDQLDHLGETIFGNVDEHGRKRKRDPIYLNWSKKSAFFKLPYFKTLLIRHNLNPMHVEKNVCEKLVGTLMNITGKTKDNENSRRDLKDLGIRPELHLREEHGKTVISHARYTFCSEEKREFCEFLSSVKFPDGYASNISNCVNTKDCRITGLKTHDYHVILQMLLPIALRGLLTKEVRNPIIELGLFLRS